MKGNSAENEVSKDDAAEDESTRKLSISLTNSNMLIRLNDLQIEFDSSGLVCFKSTRTAKNDNELDTNINEAIR